MEENKDKIPSPFETPEGYFESFEARLAERMANPKGKSGNLSVTHKRTIKVEWIAVAAAVAALLVTAWFVLKPKVQEKTELVKVKPLQKDSIKLVPEEEVMPDSATRVQTENNLAESILEDASTPEKPTVLPVVASGSVEEQIARELEDAGLIVLEDENSLFSEIEIMP